MKKIIYLFISLFFAIGGYAQQNRVPYSDLKFIKIPDINQLKSDKAFTMDDIRNWTGTGDNQSALAIQWVTGDNATEPTIDDIHFLVWGYHWKNEEKPTGESLLRAVAKSDPRFFVIFGESWGQNVIWGIGYDANNDGQFSITNSQTNITYTKEDFIDGCLTVTSAPDGFKPDDSNDYWMGGWYDAYSTYWLGDDGNAAPSSFSYSSFGASIRELTNRSWDAWTFSSINSDHENVNPIPRLMQAAEVSIPENNEQIDLNQANVYYSNGVLYLNKANNFKCSIITTDGKVINNFQVNEEEMVYPVYLPAGYYILSGNKGKAKISLKFKAE